MSLLKHLFGTTETIAKEIEADDESIVKHWKRYLETVPRKKEAIESINVTDFANRSGELKGLLASDLVDISDEEKEESDLISDLEELEHSKKIKRVHRLAHCLDYAESQYEYVHGLLHHLHSTLKSELHILKKLTAGPKHPDKLIADLKSQMELELEIIKKIEHVESFHDLFLALVKGEHIIHVMDSKERLLQKKMHAKMMSIFSGEITEGMLYEWAISVYDEVQSIVTDHEAILDNGYMPHEDVDFEFVNKPGFVEIARRNIVNLRGKAVDDRMLNVFVHIFREWYNHGRD